MAILGIGLIGGSVGLAARRDQCDGVREVVGFDPDPETRRQAIELGAVDVAADSVSEACAGADLVFCAAPVGELTALVRSALESVGEGTVVTDVGSTKRQIVAELGTDPRFIGGHPLAGAETSGVSNARAELLEGARWYLTPTPTSSGVLYDRLQRTISALGSRPQAIEAAAHDRLMATISHLPHVVANVLVSQAREELSRDSENMPEVGPSFRDATRVAGSNPAIWTDIFDSNREAVGDAIEMAGRRMLESADLIRTGDRDAVAEWHSAAADDRRLVSESQLTDGPLRELRVTIHNRPGALASLALALGEAGVNITDMALYPANDMSTGAVSLWLSGSDNTERAAELVRSLGHVVVIVDGGGDGNG